MHKQPHHAAVHRPMLVAIAVIGAAVTVVHGIVGHGGACILVGGIPRAASTTEFWCDQIAGWQYTLVAPAGSTANVSAAIGGLGVLRGAVLSRSTLRYFLWVFIRSNLFHAGRYMLLGPFTDYGDWAYVIQRWTPAVLWKVGMTALGYGLCVLGQRVAALPDWQALLGRDPEQRRMRMHLLTRVPFLTAVGVSLLAGLWSPLRLEWALVSAGLAPLVLEWLVTLPRWPQATAAAAAVPLSHGRI